MRTTVERSAAVTLRTRHFATPSQTGRTLASSAAIFQVAFDAGRWLSPDARLLAFDRKIHAAEDRGESFELLVLGPEPALSWARAQIALRYQRLFPRRNAASAHARFEAILARHAALHDRSKPLVRADHDHAIDVWQWLLRLSPEASEAAQIAALFHDIERLVSEPERRVEQHAPDYLAFKERHAARGAAMMRATLAELDDDLRLAPEVLACAETLIARHEQPGTAPELTLLNEADALSFFALNSPGFLAYFGPEHTAKKVRYTLARLRSQAALAALDEVRLEPEIVRMIAEAPAPSADMSQPT